MNHLYTIEGKVWQTVLRILTLVTLFAGSYALVQAILLVIRDWEMQNVSMLVVTIYVLVTPFAFTAALFWAYSVHRMAQTGNGDMALILGYAMMLMAAVDNLVYISIHRDGDSLSLFILGGIELVCFVICFLYYQGIGNFAMTLCAVILIVAAEALKLEEAVRYLSFIGLYAFNGYYFVERLLETLLAVESLLFVFAVKRGYIQKRT